jgi:mRNA-degrading endonuclease toxin of MazEF toxin-antitoxin module
VGKGEGGLDVPSITLCDQTRTIDKRRIAKKLGRLSGPTMKEIDRALRISLALD